MLSANISNEVRKSVYRRDGWRCALCDDTRGLQVHHVVRRSQGGTSYPHNLITLCWKCHAAAHGTKIADYPDYVDQDYIEQAVIEYLSDLYACDGVIWNPWGKP